MPDLKGLYNSMVQNESPYRNPVILIPGLLGSKLVDKDTGSVVWGAFGLNTISPRTAEGARLIAIPMFKGKKLEEMCDNVESAGTLDRVQFNFLGYPLEQTTYANILRVLGIGGYRDQNLGEAGVIDYGNRHFTCFQFDYDWRRDIVESAKKLDVFIKEKKNTFNLKLKNASVLKIMMLNLILLPIPWAGLLLVIILGTGVRIYHLTAIFRK
ncbi:MAG: hypothetical protein P1P89_08330 [Desulfobacterales bacterium]|nr:hypothetical protein [Desulfobacterales bacterium]